MSIPWVAREVNLYMFYSSGSVVDDFERVSKAVKNNGNNRYFLLTTGIKIVGDTQNPKIQFNSDEKQSIDRIKSYCYSITHHNLNIVESGENYIMFEYDDGLGCGIVYTTDINSHWGFFSDYGYTKLAKNWYAYYRWCGCIAVSDNITQINKESHHS